MVLGSAVRVQAVMSVVRSMVAGTDDLAILARKAHFRNRGWRTAAAVVAMSRFKSSLKALMGTSTPSEGPEPDDWWRDTEPEEEGPDEFD
jgi:hypothetical protein